MIEIALNGEKRSVAEGTTIAALLDELKIESKVMACALNTEIVKREAWSQTALKAQDKVELLQFVGGG